MILDMDKTLQELLATYEAALATARANSTPETRAAAVAASAAYSAAAPKTKPVQSHENTAAARSGRRQHAEMEAQRQRHLGRR